MDRVPSRERRHEAIETVTGLFETDEWTINFGPRSGPSAIASPVGDDDGVNADDGAVNADVPRAKPLAIEPLSPAEATPTTIASRLAHGERRERNVLFVADDTEATQKLEETLGEPFLLADRRDGLRTFYDGPDRIPVAAGGYALTAAPMLFTRWRETETPAGRLPGEEIAGGPRIVLEVDGNVVAIAPNVDGLSIPRANTFPFRYFRDPETKRFYVCQTRDGPGGPIEDFGGVTEMRDAGYRPVSMPLVPEHLFADGPPDWAVVDHSGSIVLGSVR